MNELCDAALAYAERGWPVFPLEPGGKKPHGRLAPNGLHNATLDQLVIARWWQRAPAANIGIRCGAVSGLLVVDVDGERGKTTLDELVATHEPLPHTAWCRTPGGWHYLFTHPGGQLGNSAGRLGPGLDTRGDGGYIVAAPSHRPEGTYRLHERPLADLPAWILAILRPPPRPRPATSDNDIPSGRTRGAAYAVAAYDQEVAAVREAAPGTRNDTLNRAAFNLGQFVGAAALDAHEVAFGLREAALHAGLTENEAEATIVSGLRAGVQTPRRLDA